MRLPNIVILDGGTINPGDLSWGVLSRYGKLTIYERTAPDEIIPRCKDADIILTNKIPIGEKEMAALPKLQYISVTATGYNIIDIDAAASRNIVVSNIPAYSTDSVAQHVFAFILYFARKVGDYARSVRNGDWQRSVDFSYSLNRIPELNGKILGIVGYGKIGQKTAQIAKAFGMEVLVHTRSRAHILPQGFCYMDLTGLLQKSDFISLHVPLTEKTRHLINRENLIQIKPTAILINTARGGLIDEAALAHALNRNEIAGAGLDVLTQEPPVNGSPLIDAQNCAITPHVAWAAFESRKRLMEILIQNLAGFLDKAPQNRVG